MLKAGDKAPAFELPGTGGPIKLEALLAGGPLVLYFFPKAMTSGCTVEANEFNQMQAGFRGLGVTVIGVSVDSVERLQRFREKYALEFPFVSDTERVLGEAYGVFKTPGGSYARDTFVIAKDGMILAAFEKAKAAGHAANILETVQQLRESKAI